jgi:hypothetical protein
MLKQTPGQTSASHQSDFAPALDAEPVYERPAEGRWDIGPAPAPFAPFLPNAAGSWADTRSAFDIGSAPGPGFLDPGSHALLNHVAPMMASETFHIGALAGASSDLVSVDPSYGGGGGGGGGGDDDPKNKRSRGGPPSR